MQPLALLRLPPQRLYHSSRRLRASPPPISHLDLLAHYLARHRLVGIKRLYPHFDQPAAVRELRGEGSIAVFKAEFESQLESVRGEAAKAERRWGIKLEEQEKVFKKNLKDQREQFDVSLREEAADAEQRWGIKLEEERKHSEDRRREQREEFDVRFREQQDAFTDLAEATLPPRIATSSYLLQFNSIALHFFRVRQIRHYYKSHQIPKNHQDPSLVPFNLLTIQAYQASLKLKARSPPSKEPLFTQTPPINTFFYGPEKLRAAAMDRTMELSRSHEENIITQRHRHSHHMSVKSIAYCVSKTTSEALELDTLRFQHIFNCSPSEYVEVSGKPLNLFNPSFSEEELAEFITQQKAWDTTP